MQITVLKSKVHRARVTGGNINYEGSLTLDAAVMKKVGLLPRERILVGNMSNGERFETYVIVGRAGSKDVVLNGATAHLGKKGDLLTIMSFAILTPREAKKFLPQVVVMEPAAAR